MKHFFYLFFYALLLFSCGGGNNSTHDYDYEFTGESSEVLDGDYCAEIEYYNPDTGTNNTYTLPIEVSNGYLTRIKWSNGGWLDNSHFTEPEFEGDTTSFTDDRGRKYKVTIINDGSCGYSSYITPEEDDRRAIEEQQEIEDHICSRCGGRKFYSFDDYCDDCERDLEEENEW